MLQKADDAGFLYWTSDFDMNRYQDSIKGSLYSKEESPVIVSQKLIEPNNRKYQLAIGVGEVKRAINNRLDVLIDALSAYDFPEYPKNEIIFKIDEIRNKIIQSKNRNTAIDYRTFRKIENNYILTTVNAFIGKTAEKYKLFYCCIDDTINDLNCQETQVMISAAEAGTGALAFGLTSEYIVGGVIVSLSKNLYIVNDLIKLNDILSKTETDTKPLRQRINEIPQDMVLEFPLELQALWDMVENISYYINYYVGANPKTEMDPYSGTLNTYFKFMGRVFTPIGAIDILIKCPDQSEMILNLNASDQGEFRYDWMAGAAGQYSWSAIDKVSGKTSNEIAFMIAQSNVCVVSEPGEVEGPIRGKIDSSIPFTSGPATCSNEHSIEYQFNWGDGAISLWSGSKNASHSWSTAGVFIVRTRVRCSVNTTIVSNWSVGKSIAISISPDVQWARDYTANMGGIFSGIQQTSDGGFIACGYTINSSNTNDLWVIKTTCLGEIEWQRSLGNSGGSWANSVIETKNGDFILLGARNGGQDIWVIELSITGGIVWQRNYGGQYEDGAKSIIQTADGGYIIAGYSYSFGKFKESALVIKINPTGDIQWQNIYEGGTAFGIKQVPNGGYILLGRTHNPTIFVWVMKLSENGNIEWQKGYDGGYCDWGYSIDIAEDGGFLIGGITSHPGVTGCDYLVMKISSTGNMEWGYSYGGSNEDWANSGKMTKDGGYVLAGYTYIGFGNCAVSALKTFKNGDIQWQKSYNLRSGSRAFDILQTSSGDFVLAGAADNGTKDDAVILLLSTAGEISSSCGFIANTNFSRQTETRTPIVTSFLAENTSPYTSTSIEPAFDTNSVSSIICKTIQSINITSPNGSESWVTGSIHNITWTTEGSISNVKIESSTNTGLSYSTVIASTTNNGSYSWTVPNTPSATCLIRVSDASNSANSDVSNAIFSILATPAPTLVMTSPNGGESWVMGSSQKITWISAGAIANIKIEYSINNGSSFSTVIDSFPNINYYTWMIPNSPSTTCLVRVSDASNSAIADVCDSVFTIMATVLQKEDLLVTWTDLGVFYRNSDTGGWTQLAGPATKITAGDLDGDGIDDLIGIWPSQGGVWVKYSHSGSWALLSSTADWIATGDMNGDGGAELVGSWSGQGVFWRNNSTGAWTQLAGPATKITAGDLDGDGIDDLIGIWPSQGGVLVKYSQSGSWALLSSTADWIAAGDMNRDGRVDLLGAWTGLGVYYRNSMTGHWVLLASPATMITTGDLDADGKSDLIGIWSSQGGVWVKYSQSETWAYLSSTADWIAAGKMRAVNGRSFVAGKELPQPIGGIAVGPKRAICDIDLHTNGPGRDGFALIIESNLEPEKTLSQLSSVPRIPGPGEPGFKYSLQKNLFSVQNEVKQNTKER